MVKTLTYDNPDHKIKINIQQFQVMGKSTGQINNSDSGNLNFFYLILNSYVFLCVLSDNMGCKFFIF